MSRTTSEAMDKAIKACTTGPKKKRLSPTVAAEQFGVKRNSIYKHASYRAYIEKTKEASHA